MSLSLIHISEPTRLRRISYAVFCPEDKQEEVRAFVTEVNRSLPLYKRISAVEFTAEPLPRNALGKLLRK